MIFNLVFGCASSLGLTLSCSEDKGRAEILSVSDEDDVNGAFDALLLRSQE